MKKILLTTLLVTWCLPGFALREFYSQSKSIRAMGMGGAYYGLSNDEAALFYNPAGLDFYESGSQGMLSISPTISPSVTDAISTLTGTACSGAVDTCVDALQQFQGQALYGGASVIPYYVRKGFAVGLLVADAKLNFTILGRDLDTSVDVTGITDSGLFFGYATEVYKGITIGANVKGMFRVGGRRIFSVLDIAQNQNLSTDFNDLGGGGVGVDFDLGATYELPKVPWNGFGRISLVVNNMLASDFPIARFGTKAPPGLVRMLTVGTHARFPGVWKFTHFDALLDLAEFGIGGNTDINLGSRSSSFFKHVNVGGETSIGRWLFIRLGFRQGYPTAGLGFDFRFLRLDLATWQEELFGSPGRFPNRRFAARIAFGVGASKPAVAPMTQPMTQPVPNEAPKFEIPNQQKIEEPPAEAAPTSDSGTSGRNLSSQQRKIEIPKDDNDRFDVDNYTSDIPRSHNYGN